MGRYPLPVFSVGVIFQERLLGIALEYDWHSSIRLTGRGLDVFQQLWVKILGPPTCRRDCDQLVQTDSGRPQTAPKMSPRYPGDGSEVVLFQGITHSTISQPSFLLHTQLPVALENPPT